MLVYLFPLFITLFATVRYDINGHKDGGRIICWNGLFLYLVLLLGLRFEVGGDTLNYMMFYESQSDLSQWTFSFGGTFQPLYSFLCSITKTVSSDFYVFQFLHAILLNSLLFYFISRNTQHRFLCLFVIFMTFYLYFSTEILRESLAVLIFAINFENLRKGNWLRYYVGVTICVLFHLSALILTILPFFRWIKLNSIFPVLLLVFVLMFRLDMLHSWLDGFELMAKVSSYTDMENGGYLYTAINLLSYLFLPLSICGISRRLLHKEQRFENMLCLMSISSLCAIFSFVIFGRFVNYFLPFLAVSITDVFYDMIRSRKVRQLGVVLIMFFLVLFGYQFVYLKRYTLWIPYSSVIYPEHVRRYFYDYTN